MILEDPFFVLKNRKIIFIMDLKYWHHWVWSFLSNSFLIFFFVLAFFSPYIIQMRNLIFWVFYRQWSVLNANNQYMRGSSPGTISCRILRSCCTGRVNSAWIVMWISTITMPAPIVLTWRIKESGTSRSSQGFWCCPGRDVACYVSTRPKFFVRSGIMSMLFSERSL